VGKKNQAPPTVDAMVKIKDKEISNQNQMINNLKKDNSTLRNRIDTEVGLEKLMKYENSLKEAEKRNQELLREIKALQRIQTEQGKALEKMTTENDYVGKIKGLMDELRMAKEKIKEMEEKMKKDEKTMKSQFEHMMKLQEKCKELKS
jgi:DNA repair exonuclease SbcCD ATPase subunit